MTAATCATRSSDGCRDGAPTGGGARAVRRSATARSGCGSTPRARAGRWRFATTRRAGHTWAKAPRRRPHAKRSPRRAGHAGGDESGGRGERMDSDGSGAGAPAVFARVERGNKIDGVALRECMIRAQELNDRTLPIGLEDAPRVIPKLTGAEIALMSARGSARLDLGRRVRPEEIAGATPHLHAARAHERVGRTARSAARRGERCARGRGLRRDRGGKPLGRAGRDRGVDGVGQRRGGHTSAPARAHHRDHAKDRARCRERGARTARVVRRRARRRDRDRTREGVHHRDRPRRGTGASARGAGGEGEQRRAGRAGERKGTPSRSPT